ncbi:MAG: hypothetical protein M3O50_01890 [Myxococcota bacterium]|nr:hypothetical protein [Myxococcota bacterium]
MPAPRTGSIDPGRAADGFASFAVVSVLLGARKGNMARTRLGALLVLVACSAVACAGASSHAIVGPHETTSHRIKCHPDLDDCWEEAGNICGSRGYDVLDRSMHMGGTLADAIPGPVTWYVVLVTCK